ncbi:hypothetical protein ACKVEX_03425 [Rhodocyclaceae bacterium SMB388]
MRFIVVFAALVAALVAPAWAERIVEARYVEPVQRYGHFALGRPHEYARVVATTDAGRELALELPADEVFEDLVPRLVGFTTDGPTELLVIVSARGTGARLALIGLDDGALRIVAQSAPIGTPNRWLNPVGVADLNGDGVAEVAAVTTPHIGGVLRVYRRVGERLTELASLSGFSNHVYGSPELDLSRPATIGGRMQLLVPDLRRTSVVAITLENGRLVETGRCRLAAPVTDSSALSACVARMGAAS